ncbi:MAG: glycosyltransferase family 4 protein [Candidatus Cryosericum sp.]
MNICLVVPSLRECGPVRVVHDLAFEYTRMGHNVDVLYFDEGPGMAMPTSQRVGMCARVHMSDYDVIHTHGIRPDAAVWLHRDSIRCPCISTAHNYAREDFHYTYGRFVAAWGPELWQILRSRHEVLVALSQDMANYYSRRGRDHRWTYVYNGIPLQSENPQQPDSGDDLDRINELKSRFRVIGSVAGLTRRKGLDQILRVLPDFGELGLVVIGDGPELVGLQMLATRLAVASRCLFLGARPQGSAYMSLFDMYGLPSRSEGFPLALLEAARAGIPVIASALPALKEAFSNSEVAFFMPDDLTSLRAAIQECVTHSAAYATSLHAKYLASFTSTHMAEQYIAIYEKALHA